MNAGNLILVLPTSAMMPKSTLERHCEIIAAIKVRTSNKQGRHLSTAGAIRLLEKYGIETPDGFVQVPPEVLKKTTVNRYLKQWGYDRHTLLQPPPAVRFQADHSNECWQFDLSPSDLKHVKAPAWMEEGRGRPLLMLYSIVDDRSGLAYQEYHGVYGEDVEAALRFLFAAMSPKSTEGFPLQGIPQMIYMDNGPIARLDLLAVLQDSVNFARIVSRGKAEHLSLLSQELVELEVVPVDENGGVEFDPFGFRALWPPETAQAGDVVLFAEISRMARSTLQVLEILEQAMTRALIIHIAKQRMVLDGSMQSRIMATVLGLTAEIERELISMRTIEALAKRKAAGMPLGRPKGTKAKRVKLDNKEAEIRSYLDKSISKRSIAKLVECSPSTLYDWMARRNIRPRGVANVPRSS